MSLKNMTDKWLVNRVELIMWRQFGHSVIVRLLIAVMEMMMLDMAIDIVADMAEAMMLDNINARRNLANDLC